MVDLTYIDHVEVGLSLLPSQWEGKPVVNGVLASWLTPLNTTERQALDVRDGFNVTTAVGSQLDIIGGYFGELRAGRNDEDYRNAILSIIASSNGSGTPPQIMSLYQTLTSCEDVSIWEHYPLSLSLLSSKGFDTNPNIEDYMKVASAASIEYAALMYDPYEWAWIPNDSSSDLVNVIESTGGDNVIINSGDNVVADVIVEDIDDGSFRSSFVDISVPEPQDSGYGLGYGENYGGANDLTSQFVDTVTARGQDFSGGNGFLLWAEQEEDDPITGTPNKVEPIRQFMDSGLKRKQPMPRQFFNWLIAKSDDWFNHISQRYSLGSVLYTYDQTKTASDYDTQFGGTWASIGNEVLAMQSGGTETIYIFVRTT